jgi:hypothetical protein
MIKTINTASTRLTVLIKAANKAKDKTTIYTKAVKGEYTKEINDIKEIKKQYFHRRDIMSAINQIVNLLSILLKSKRRHIRSSINIHYIY